MSVSSVEVIMGRIQSASKESPIAVFTTRTGFLFNAVFANTVATQALIQKGTQRLVGVYDQTAPMEVVRQRLINLVKKAEASSVASDAA